MDSATVVAAAERCAAAWRRGYERGHGDNACKFYDESPLSGEWAGYSERELLGDLFDEAERDYMIDNELDSEDSVMYWSDFAEISSDCDTIVEHYLTGYRAAFNDDDVVLCAGCESVIHRFGPEVSSVELDNNERDYYCSEYCVK